LGKGTWLCKYCLIKLMVALTSSKLNMYDNSK
jgi:hypothetical protein